jgi:hypothetical protein
MEIEVEYVRRQKVVFECDPDDGIANFQPMQVGRVFRAVQFYMHHGKDLVKHEEPRLIGWHVLDQQCVCEVYGDHMHSSRDEAQRCNHCPCSCAPTDGGRR